MDHEELVWQVSPVPGRPVGRVCPAAPTAGTCPKWYVTPQTAAVVADAATAVHGVDAGTARVLEERGAAAPRGAELARGGIRRSGGHGQAGRERCGGETRRNCSPATEQAGGVT